MRNAENASWRRGRRDMNFARANIILCIQHFRDAADRYERTTRSSGHFPGRTHPFRGRFYQAYFQPDLRSHSRAKKAIVRILETITISMEY